MSDEKEHFEERTVTLKVTKRRATEEEAQTLDVPGGNCGPWFIEFRGGIYYTCRWCTTEGPTYIPYKECIELPS